MKRRWKQRQENLNAKLLNEYLTKGEAIVVLPEGHAEGAGPLQFANRHTRPNKRTRGKQPKGTAAGKYSKDGQGY